MEKKKHNCVLIFRFFYEIVPFDQTTSFDTFFWVGVSKQYVLAYFWKFWIFSLNIGTFWWSGQFGGDFLKIDQNLTSKFCDTFSLENYYRIHAKHSAFDASQRDDSAHIFKIFETQKIWWAMGQKVVKIGPGWALSWVAGGVWGPIWKHSMSY